MGSSKKNSELKSKNEESDFSKIFNVAFGGLGISMLCLLIYINIPATLKGGKKVLMHCLKASRNEYVTSAGGEIFETINKCTCYIGKEGSQELEISNINLIPRFDGVGFEAREYPNGTIHSSNRDGVRSKGIIGDYIGSRMLRPSPETIIAIKED